VAPCYLRSLYLRFCLFAIYECVPKLSIRDISLANFRFIENKICIKPALSNPFATRHMWRIAIRMWRTTPLPNI